MDRQGMRTHGSSYEVRCLRCDVSFPVETRRCIHCGGATSASSAGIGVGGWAEPIESTAGGMTTPTSSGSTSPGPIPTVPSPLGGSDEPDMPSDAGPQQGVGAALLRSFGSLFWIIALIGFSFARSCSEG